MADVFRADYQYIIHVYRYESKVTFLLFGFCLVVVAIPHRLYAGRAAAGDGRRYDRTTVL